MSGSSVIATSRQAVAPVIEKSARSAFLRSAPAAVPRIDPDLLEDLQQSGGGEGRRSGATHQRIDPSGCGDIGKLK